VSKINTHFYVQYFFFRKSCRLRDNVKNNVEPGRPQMTRGRMRIACCKPEATNTPSEYVNTHCCSTTTMVEQTHLNVTLCYIACRVLKQQWIFWFKKKKVRMSRLATWLSSYGEMQKSMPNDSFTQAWFTKYPQEYEVCVPVKTSSSWIKLKQQCTNVMNISKQMTSTESTCGTSVDGRWQRLLWRQFPLAQSRGCWKFHCAACSTAPTRWVGWHSAH
jgi:hypothetical protein